MASKTFKYLRINLTKEVKDPNNENFKLLKKDIGKDLPHSRVRTYIVEMPPPHPPTQEPSPDSVQSSSTFPTQFLTCIGTRNLKFHMDTQKTQGS